MVRKAKYSFGLYMTIPVFDELMGSNWRRTWKLSAGRSLLELVGSGGLDETLNREFHLQESRTIACTIMSILTSPTNSSSRGGEIVHVYGFEFHFRPLSIQGPWHPGTLRRKFASECCGCTHESLGSTFGQGLAHCECAGSPENRIPCMHKEIIDKLLAFLLACNMRHSAGQLSPSRRPISNPVSFGSWATTHFPACPLTRPRPRKRILMGR
jgi:hypothetical protein